MMRRKKKKGERKKDVRGGKGKRRFTETSTLLSHVPSLSLSLSLSLYFLSLTSKQCSRALP